MGESSSLLRKINNDTDGKGTNTLLNEAVLLQLPASHMVVSELSTHGQAIVSGVLVGNVPSALHVGALTAKEVGYCPLPSLELPQKML